MIALTANYGMISSATVDNVGASIAFKSVCFARTNNNCTNPIFSHAEIHKVFKATFEEALSSGYVRISAYVG